MHGQLSILSGVGSPEHEWYPPPLTTNRRLSSVFQAALVLSLGWSHIISLNFINLKHQQHMSLVSIIEPTLTSQDG